MSADDKTLVRTITVAERCTVPIPTASGVRYVVALEEGDKLTISRKFRTVDLTEIARRLDQGESFHCGLTDCPGYTFEPGELSHHDPRHPELCAADLRENAKRNADMASSVTVLELRSLVGDE
jgi:hypothetical protein